MAENESFDREELVITGGTSFSQLLFAEDNALKGVEGNNSSFNFAHSSSPAYISSSPTFSTGKDKTPKMLCFGDYPEKVNQELVFPETTTKASQRSIVTCSDSFSSVSSSNSINTSCKSTTKKRDGSEQLSKAVSQNQRSSKKSKTENPTSTIPAKKKEKLGERIAALQQLVSPFGKTDTASVLHEAMGYIKFLQDQVQVMCSPYLQRLPSLPEEEKRGENGKEEEMRKDLRSRGLCLVPVECTVHVANSNGADFWSPAMANNNVPVFNKLEMKM